MPDPILQRFASMVIPISACFGYTPDHFLFGCKTIFSLQQKSSTCSLSPKAALLKRNVDSEGRRPSVGAGRAGPRNAHAGALPCIAEASAVASGTHSKAVGVR